MSNFAKFFVHDQERDIALSTDGEPMFSPVTMMMPPGGYLFDDESYDCTEQGLYRFRRRREDGEPAEARFLNRIVWGCDRTNGRWVRRDDFDIYALMSAINWNHIHGRKDDDADPQSVSNAGTFRKWRSTCGGISEMVDYLLSFTGEKCRIVNVETTEASNGYDDGHILVETLTNGKWRMWDNSRGRYFVDDNGEHLSLAEFMDMIRDGGPMPAHVMLARDRLWDYDSVGQFDHGLHAEFFRSTPEQLERWYRRIYQRIYSVK